MVGAIIAVIFLALLWAIVLYFELSIWIAVVATAVILTGAVVLFLWKRLKSRAAAGEIEKALTSQANAQAEAVRPDQQVEIKAMQGEFAKAVQSLKSSKLARGGSDALAVLPWYLIIGPPGAGKSTALRNSGLQFPYLSSARGGGVRGVGGTRNCEWWLTNEAVVLDTAGRYTTEEEDRDEWFSFLDMLARTRTQKPINGVMVAVSIADVGGETEDGVVDLAKRIRERVDEVMQRLSMVVPAYLLFTKCDLLPGFVESFADLRKNERGQIWGFTVPIAESKEAPGDLFRERFDELLSCVEERALQRMGQERHVDSRERIYQFPQQLAFAKNNLATFVETLFAGNVYQDTPIMRGVYFTSGTQEGRTVDRVMNAMSEAFGIRAPAETQEPVVEAKSYFLRDVFKKVIFPDQDVAVRNAKAVQQQIVQRYVLAGAMLFATAFLLVFPIRSFIQNRELITSTREVVEAVGGKLGQNQARPPLRELEPLREQLAVLVKYDEEGPDFSMRFGMYQGHRLTAPLRMLYGAAARRIVIDPIFNQDVADMEAFANAAEASGAIPDQAEHARFYEKLKMHLFLTAPRASDEPKIGEAEQAWLAQQIADRWGSRISVADDPAGPKHIADNAALFMKLLAEDQTLALPRYDRTVLRVRSVLGRLSRASLALAKLATEADEKGYDLSLPTIIGSTAQFVRSEGRVRGAYTKRGYDEVIKKRLDDPSGLLEYWVLSPVSKGGGESKELAQLKTLYYSEYITQWKAFLDGIQVQTVGKDKAIELLRELTRGEPALYPRLFRAVGANTRFSGLADTLKDVGGGRLEKLKKKFGKEGAAAVRAATAAIEDDNVGPDDVQQYFAGFVQFGFAPEPPKTETGAPPPKSVPLDVYQEQLALLRDELQQWKENPGTELPVAKAQEARNKIRGLLDRLDIGFMRPRLEALLWPPIDAVTTGVIHDLADQIGVQWCAEVYVPFRDLIAKTYPFVPTGRDVPLGDLADIFRPKTGKLWTFVDTKLRGSVQKAGTRHQFVQVAGGPTGFRSELVGFLDRADEITASLFATGAPDPKVDFSYVIHPSPGIAMVTFEIDGQRYDYRNGPEEWRSVTWPGSGIKGATIRVRPIKGKEELIQHLGDWGLFRLLEMGTVKSVNGNNFTMSWEFLSLGATITIDFKSNRTQAPFFGNPGGRPRLLRPFRTGTPMPGVIARAPCK